MASEESTEKNEEQRGKGRGGREGGREMGGVNTQRMKGVRETNQARLKKKLSALDEGMFMHFSSQQPTLGRGYRRKGFLFDAHETAQINQLE